MEHGERVGETSSGATSIPKSCVGQFRTTLARVVLTALRELAVFTT